jgi:hypothetical protein
MSLLDPALPTPLPDVGGVRVGGVGGRSDTAHGLTVAAAYMLRPAWVDLCVAGGSGCSTCGEHCEIKMETGGWLAA